MRLTLPGADELDAIDNAVPLVPMFPPLLTTEMLGLMICAPDPVVILPVPVSVSAIAVFAESSKFGLMVVPVVVIVVT